jgi:hypothetical protein
MDKCRMPNGQIFSVGHLRCVYNNMKDKNSQKTFDYFYPSYGLILLSGIFLCTKWTNSLCFHLFICVFIYFRTLSRPKPTQDCSAEWRRRFPNALNTLLDEHQFYVSCVVQAGCIELRSTQTLVLVRHFVIDWGGVWLSCNYLSEYLSSNRWEYTTQTVL